jgi:hypothetical protein
MEHICELGVHGIYAGTLCLGKIFMLQRIYRVIKKNLCAPDDYNTESYN